MKNSIENIETQEDRFWKIVYLLPWPLFYDHANAQGYFITIYLYINQVLSRSDEIWQRNSDFRFFLFCVLVTLTFWPSHPKMYTALVKVIIFHLAKFEKDRIIYDREIKKRRW